MATSAFYDGRKAGYYGNVRTANPHSKYATDWENGYIEGAHLRMSTLADLMRSIDNLESLVKNGGPK